MGIQARMHETTLTATTSSLVLNEIQQIDVSASVTSEQQVIEKISSNIKVFLLLKLQQFSYTTTSSNGTAAVQSLEVAPSIFQIGFRGVYTGTHIIFVF